ncbi:IS3 family transposase, partial [Polynucleobacter sp. AM-25C3]|nr:IS3 family transposase [Polynucleobacter sp. AM-25C3]
MASQQVHSGRMSIRLACDTFVISQTCYRYHPKLSTDNALIADWLVRLTQNQR